jgi:hypothetical protein
VGRACSTVGGEVSAYRILSEKPEGNRPRHRWVDLREIPDQAQYGDQWRALVNTVVNPRVP